MSARRQDLDRVMAQRRRRLDRWTWARAIRALSAVASSTHSAQKRAWRLIANNLEAAERFIEASPRPRRPVRDRTSAEAWLRRQLDGFASGSRQA
jgi:hypothetical protein